MSHDAEMDAAMSRIGVLRFRLDEAKAENARLQAEVERLRKAGIAMGMCLPDTDEANNAYRVFERIVNGGKS